MSEWPDPTERRDAAERLARVREQIEAACRRANRDPAEVTLVGACKRQPLGRIAAAVAAGLSELGENYVQEASTVRPALEALILAHGFEAPRWRMIGHLQRNKVGQAVGVFDAVDTVDRARLASALAKRVAAQSPDARLDVCLQIDFGDETTKSGAAAEGAEELFAACAAHPELRVVGLMTMPPPDRTRARSAFQRLRALRDTLSRHSNNGPLTVLSMGMSGDFEIAIEEGATHVRVGTALFGERAPRP